MEVFWKDLVRLVSLIDLGGILKGSCETSILDGSWTYLGVILGDWFPGWILEVSWKDLGRLVSWMHLGRILRDWYPGWILEVSWKNLGRLVSWIHLGS